MKVTRDKGANKETVCCLPMGALAGSSLNGSSFVETMKKT